MKTRSESDRREFNQRLKVVLERDGMSQAEFGRRVGLTDSAVSDWFVRNAMPSGEILFRIPKVLNVSLDYLSTGEGRPMREGTTPNEAFDIGAGAALARVQQELDALRREFGVGGTGRGSSRGLGGKSRKA